MRTWVKICGVTRAEDARAAFDAGADAIGINFSSGSRRHCSLEKARTVLEGVYAGELVFGVFVDSRREEVARIVRELGLGGVQFHGRETSGDVAGWKLPTLRAVAAASRAAVTGAIAVRDQFMAANNAGYRLLVDHGSGGGSGQPIDETLLDGIDLSESILAGGLTPANVAARVARFRPYGVDTAGGVETAPGIKDAEAIEAFVRAARSEPSEDWV